MASPAVLPIVLASAALVLYAVVWTVGLVGTLTIYIRYSAARRNRVPLVPSSQQPCGVSILRPLKGLDPQLEECLESAFRQNYPLFEILLSVADELDPAAKVATTLIAKYPNVPARLIIGEENVGPNPKVNNLVRSYAAAKYDIIWILDANTHVPSNTLQHSMDKFFESTFSPRPTQLVHHLPLCVVSRRNDNPGWGARLEELYLSTSHAKFYVAINKFAIAPCVMGKSNLFRKSVLDAATGGGGLAKFANFIAEDHLIADTLWYRTPNPGPNHGMTVDVARQPVQSETFRTYVERRVRWIRVRKYMVTSATLIEPFTECFLAGFLGALSLHTLIPTVVTSVRRFLFWHIFIWWAIDLRQYYTLQCNSQPDLDVGDEAPEFSRGQQRGFWEVKRLGMWIVCWVIRESTCLPIWIVAMAGQSVVKWRNRRFLVRRDMTVVEIPESHENLGVEIFRDMVNGSFASNGFSEEPRVN